MAVDSTKKSSRLLQSRRYTLDTFSDAQEAFTKVLDLNSSEIYSQQNLILTSSLPYSGSSQNKSIVGVTKFWYRQRMTPGGETNGRQVWFFLEPFQTSIDSQVLQATQVVNFVSPKYSIPSLATSNTELTTPGYLVTVTTSSDGSSFSQPLNPNNYAFDYKTGVLQFNTAGTTPSSGNVYITAYQYIGRTLESDITEGYSGSFSGSFQGNGAGLTNLPASSIVGLNLTQIANTTVSASVSTGATSFQLISGSNTLFNVNNNGNITSAGSASFKDTTVTGSLLVTQNFTVLGTASFTRVTGSEIVIGSPTITLNTDEPVVRFGGLVVVDSGSFGATYTSSFLYDGTENQWIFQHEGTENSGSSIAIFGPLNTGELGTEQGLTEYTIPRAYTDHGHHIGNSNIYSTGSNLTINKGITGSINGVEILGDLEVTGSVRVTAGVSGSFSGSFAGNGNNLTNIPANSIVGLNLTQIADGTVSASVSASGNPFIVRSGGTIKFEVTDNGGIKTFSTSSLGDIQVTGSAIIQDTLTIEDTLLVSQSAILSGSIQTSGSTTLTGINILTGTTEITGSTKIISNTQVTGSINVSGSANIVGITTITGSLIVSGSSTLINIGPAEFTGSTSLLGTLNTEGTSSTVGILLSSGSTILSGSTNIEGPTNIVGLNTITGSITVNSPVPTATTVSVDTGDYALLVSQSAWFYNHNAGVPTNNAWKNNLNGSYFNNFDHNTNASEILRFIAGLLSASAPSPTPNTRTYDSVRATENNIGSTLNISAGVINGQKLSIDYTSSAQITQQFKDTINYGISKGWSAVGTNGHGEGTQPWALAGAPYTDNYSSYILTFISTASAGTGGSNSTPTLFGTGEITPPANLKVRLIGSMSFSDNASVFEPNGSTGTYTISNTIDLSRSVASNTSLDANGLAHSIIQTVNPAVIPNRFQESRFATTTAVGNTFLTRSYGGATAATLTISSSGYYNFYNLQVGYTTGSDTNYIFKTNSPIVKLWMPVALIRSSMSAAPLSITAANTEVISASIAPSRSLSGAPYLAAGTSTWNYSTTASGMFDPAFYAGTVFTQNVSENIVGTVGITSNTVSMNSDGINTSGKIYDSTGTVKNSGFPKINDVIRSTAAITHTIADTDNNISASSNGTINFTLSTTGYNFNNSPTSLDPLTNRSVPYHNPGTFGQPLSSGSLGIFGRSQGYDGSGNSGNTPIENFTGETYRRYVSASGFDILTFTAPAFSQSFGLYNLPEKELQVKPGFLVRPGGIYGYWISDPNPSDTYKYYVKEIVRVGGGTINVDFYSTGSTRPALTNWISTADGIAAGVMFESTTVSNLSVQNITSAARFFNLSTGGGTTGVTYAAGTTYNPFASSYLLFNGGGNPSSGKYTMTPDNGAGAALNSTYTKYYLVVRYKGDVPPLTQISISYT